MTKQHEYKLNFEKIVSNSGSIFALCWPNDLSHVGSAEIASLFRSTGKDEMEYLLEEVDNAIAGSSFEDVVSFDTSPSNVLLSLFNVTIDSVAIPLSDVKLLLEEWIHYLES